MLLISLILPKPLTNVIFRRPTPAFISLINHPPLRTRITRISLFTYHLLPITYNLLPKNSVRCRIFLVAQRNKFSPIFLLASILPDKLFGRSRKILYLCNIITDYIRMAKLNRIKLASIEKNETGR